MKTGFREHGVSAAIVGVFLAIALVYLSEVKLAGALVCAGAFTFSALLPDVDSKTSIPRRNFRRIVMMTGILVALAVLYYANYSAVIALVIPFVLYFPIEFLIPKHRGIMHTYLAAAAYGVIVFEILNVFTATKMSENLLVGLCAFAGYTFHLVFDWLGSNI